MLENAVEIAKTRCPLSRGCVPGGPGALIRPVHSWLTLAAASRAALARMASLTFRAWSSAALVAARTRLRSTDPMVFRRSADWTSDSPQGP